MKFGCTSNDFDHSGVQKAYDPLFWNAFFWNISGRSGLGSDHQRDVESIKAIHLANLILF